MIIAKWTVYVTAVLLMVGVRGASSCLVVRLTLHYTVSYR